MNVLVACEYSGVVRDAFSFMGHNAWSVDYLPSESPGNHFQGDIRYFLEREPCWDILIAHPPCTYLSVSGIHWNNRGRGWEKTNDALDFVKFLMDLPIDKKCIENPVSIISTHIRKPDQIIQPYEFGHDASKKTCLWLDGLPKLVPDPQQYITPRKVWIQHNPLDTVGKWVYRWDNQTDSGQNKLGPSDDRAKVRSKTYEGIARAMAEQWG